MTDYPTDEDLARIEAWPVDDLRGLFDFIRERWSLGYWDEAEVNPLKDPITSIAISTGGWSGNESLIGALQANQAAWAITWYSSRRGGHYEFRIPRQA
jgi:hypothetical protein